MIVLVGVMVFVTLLGRVASWLNQVEWWFGLTTPRAIRRGSFRHLRKRIATQRNERDVAGLGDHESAAAAAGVVHSFFSIISIRRTSLVLAACVIYAVRPMALLRIADRLCRCLAVLLSALALAVTAAQASETVSAVEPPIAAAMMVLSDGAMTHAPDVLDTSTAEVSQMVPDVEDDDVRAVEVGSASTRVGAPPPRALEQQHRERHEDLRGPT